jgi:hypothetical protein
MPLAAVAPSSRQDTIAAALCAAEANEPFDLVHVPSGAFSEFFGAVHRLRALVPFATFRLLTRLVNDERDELRVGAAHALAFFADLHPDPVEALLLPLACDSTRRVRAAAAETLAWLLRLLPDPEPLIERWRWHPDRAVDVLAKARKAAASKKG